ncbi:Spliceosome-associated protein 49 [Tieghemiomyces parasiticus]|uniref:Splicing factor 3B subunit 4 n=1 Tax=Tieghemiomyces parasiticus TaxID=78921 RepID=A0A9W7ZGV8_9FUNG|nr:Spliceosome-associated protein 49 [Tieghemiomyces parasiticus]
MSKAQERNQDASVYVGNLDDRCTDELIWELMVQAGPVVSLHLPKDRITGQHQGYGFCEFVSEEDADYATKIMNMIKLYGKPIRVNKSLTDRRNIEVGAKLYIGNLDPDVDEKLLYDTFSAFGQIMQPPRVVRDSETGNSKGFAFINYDNFESSDAAVEGMDGQYLANKPVTVNYALKKDGKGERHGSAAERLLASQAKNQPSAQPHRLFAEINSPATGAPQPTSANATPLGGAPHMPPPGVPGQMAPLPHDGGQPPYAQHSYPTPNYYPPQPPHWGGQH